ncbi:hypothetical protein [Thermomonospora umbrina]|uniref:Ig-like domain-containing protein n=1 Tax=Thermomonospora umbrina TaxID=111806 RepID=A0A3D9SKX6_9ACTN|nr:hypothetical protein [Thermomonospora umbrina]REE95060.1 hypothetical protein DFJ69_0438 [Thermomonospora umbrina]
MQRLTQIAVLGTASFLVAGIGTAYAAGRSAAPPPVIHACKAKRGGDVRIISRTAKCRSTETRVTWNQRGVAGPRGATGPRGPVGPSNVYVYSGAHVDLPDRQSRTAATLTLPPGNYVIDGHVNLRYVDFAWCTLRQGSVNSFTTATPKSGLGKHNESTIPVDGALSLPRGGTVTVTCTTWDVSSTHQTDAKAYLIATRVGSLTTLSGG